MDFKLCFKRVEVNFIWKCTIPKSILMNVILRVWPIIIIFVWSSSKTMKIMGFKAIEFSVQSIFFWSMPFKINWYFTIKYWTEFCFEFSKEVIEILMCPVSRNITDKNIVIEVLIYFAKLFWGHLRHNSG